MEEYRGQPDYATLEEDWLTEVERDPLRADWFGGIADALFAEEQGDRARGLLEIWDDELRRREQWLARLDLLRRYGPQLHRGKALQREVIATLEGVWSGKPHLGETIEWAGLRRHIEDPDKLWDRVTRVDSVLRFDAGVIVTMAGHGVGRVAEVNLALETLKIDFEKRTGVSLGFRAAAKMLRPLADDHPLRLKIEDPERLAKLRDEQPTELLRAVLRTANGPLTATEIRESLAGIVDAKRWNGWWTAARRHPQVVTVGSGRQSYRWEESESSALDAVRRSFERAEPRKKIDLMRRHVDRDPELGDELVAALAELAHEAETTDPGLAWEVAAALERSRRLPDGLDGIFARLVDGDHDVQALLSGIADRAQRERALALVRDLRPDWADVLRDQLLREEDPRVLSSIAEAVRAARPEPFDRLVDDLVAMPRRAPAAFVWYAERATDEETLRPRAPLRLLQQILAALTAEEFAPYRTRLRPMADSGGALPRLLALLDEEQAASALEAVERSQGLEEYQRDPLLNALRLRFASLGASQDASGPLYARLESIDAKRAELKRLAEVEIPANRKAIEEARALGDLRENFEYKSARQRHEYLNARVASLHRDLGRARPIDFDQLDTSEIRIGTRVGLADADGQRRSFALLGPWESRPEEGTISYESELGRTLLGRKIGEEVRVGERNFVVESIGSARD